MELLIEADADLTIKNKKGWTALHVASNRARNKKAVRLVKLMVEKEANINACTHKSKTVYKIADGRKTKRFLRSKGARKKGCDKKP